LTLKVMTRMACVKSRRVYTMATALHGGTSCVAQRASTGCGGARLRAV
jgi:hypothetical protein